MDDFKKGAVLATISTIMCACCTFLYVTSGWFQVYFPWAEIICALFLSMLIMWALTYCNPPKYEYPLVRISLVLIYTIILTGSFILMKELIAHAELDPPRKTLPVNPKRDRIMKLIDNKKTAGYVSGEIVVQFHDSTPQDMAKVFLEANGCALKAFSWEKVHIAYAICPPGTEQEKIGKLTPLVKWADRIMNHDFHS
jgi:hypothetical protein